ncbi:hypothetical protein Ciccas_010829 [Cichlidogyrus casuarinus]|uniref:EGF-like domain-containing protein n=1 Tax=Cichlidogyrus casuarinus TaxID=1844966 RepID=A0ABD2PV05_9PLAT
MSARRPCAEEINQSLVYPQTEIDPCAGVQCEHGACVTRNETSGPTPFCQCKAGWSGSQCQTKLCDRRCHDHGACFSGRCICEPGWNGPHCSIDGCPSDCNKRGQCVELSLFSPSAPSLRLSSELRQRIASIAQSLAALQESTTSPVSSWFACRCDSNWRGSACQIPVEADCSDGQDNDLDGLTDCLDPDCCETEACNVQQNETLVRQGRSQLRIQSPIEESCTEPEKSVEQLILSRQRVPHGASFYERMEFLGKRKGTSNEVFDPRLLSVVRGVVRLSNGSPLRACRVSNRLSMTHGYTLTDRQGK